MCQYSMVHLDGGRRVAKAVALIDAERKEGTQHRAGSASSDRLTVVCIVDKPRHVDWFNEGDLLVPDSNAFAPVNDGVAIDPLGAV